MKGQIKDLCKFVRGEWGLSIHISYQVYVMYIDFSYVSGGVEVIQL